MVRRKRPKKGKKPAPRVTARIILFRKRSVKSLFDEVMSQLHHKPSLDPELQSVFVEKVLALKKEQPEVAEGFINQYDKAVAQTLQKTFKKPKKPKKA